MRLLLLVLGVLALATAGLKLQDRVRSRIGTSPFALGEIVVGIAACLVASLVSDPGPLHASAAVASVLIIIISAVHQGRLTSAFSRRREQSEARRLKQFMAVQASAPANHAAPSEVPTASAESMGPDLEALLRTDPPQAAPPLPTERPAVADQTRVAARPTERRPAARPAPSASPRPRAQEKRARSEPSFADLSRRPREAPSSTSNPPQRGEGEG